MTHLTMTLSVALLVARVAMKLAIADVVVFLLAGVFANNYDIIWNLPRGENQTNVGYPEVDLFFTSIRLVAKALIFMRLGFFVSFSLKHLGLVLRLGLIPTLAECAGVIFMNQVVWQVFDHFSLAVLQGFLFGPVSPLVVLPAVVEVQERGYSAVSAVVLNALPFDTFLGSNFYLVALELVKKQMMDTDFNWETILLQFVLLFAFGFFMTLPITLVFLISPEFIRTCQKRMAALCLFPAIFIALLGKRLGYDWVSSFGPMFYGLILGFVLTRLVDGEIGKKFVDEQYVGILKWVKPGLFFGVGFKVTMSELSLKQDNFFAFSVLLTLVALLIRFGSTFLCLFLSRNTLLSSCRGGNQPKPDNCPVTQAGWKLALYLAICWLPKATIQATFASDLLMELTDFYGGPGKIPSASKADAEFINNCAVIQILITSGLGSVLLGSKKIRHLLLGAPPTSVSVQTSHCVEKTQLEGHEVC
jgi:hypothetical protein